MERTKQLARERLVLALDAEDFEQAHDLVVSLKDYIGTFKIGMHLFLKEGPKVFKMIHDEGCKIYFDGKFHDIPTSVAMASKSIVENKVDCYSIHISGGLKMLAASVESIVTYSEQLQQPKPKVFGVTILTSIGQKTLTKELGIPIKTQDHTFKLAQIAKEAGLDGIATSVCEAKLIKKEFNGDFTILTSAIRPTWAQVNDQLRVFTPKEAIEAGSDLLLIGRPITQAKEPISAVKLITDEIEEAIEGSI